MKTEAEKACWYFTESHFSGHSRTRESSKSLTSNCCLESVLTSYREALLAELRLHHNKLKTSLPAGSGRRSQRQHILRHLLSKKTKTRNVFDNLIIRPPLFMSIRSTERWQQLVPLARFTTGNSCNVCHMCSHHQQSRELQRSDLHLPQDRVYFLCKRAERSGHYSAPQTSDKRKLSAGLLSGPR